MAARKPDSSSSTVTKTASSGANIASSENELTAPAEKGGENVISSDPWLQREENKSKRPRPLPSTSSEDLGLAAGEESRRRAQSARPARDLQGSPERDGGAGTPASAGGMRRSPRNRVPMRHVESQEQGEAGTVKKELGVGRVRSAINRGKKISSPGGTKGRTGAGRQDSSDGDDEGYEQGGGDEGAPRSAVKESCAADGSFVALSSPEGAGGGLGSGDEFSYNNYCRRDKVQCIIIWQALLSGDVLLSVVSPFPLSYHNKYVYVGYAMMIAAFARS